LKRGDQWQAVCTKFNKNSSMGREVITGMDNYKYGLVLENGKKKRHKTTALIKEVADILVQCNKVQNLGKHGRYGQLWRFTHETVKTVFAHAPHHILVTCGHDEPLGYRGNHSLVLAFSLTTLLQARNCQ
jgi:hypothetical protein